MKGLKEGFIAGTGGASGGMLAAMHLEASSVEVFESAGIGFLLPFLITSVIFRGKGTEGVV